MGYLNSALRWFENVVGDIVFVIFDKAMNVLDRNVESLWVWDDEEVG